MNPKALEALRRLAAIKAQRALGELAAARAEAQRGAETVRAAEEATAQTYQADGAEAPAQWRVRAALERRASAARAALTARRADEDEARDRAAAAVAREQGVEALADRARAASQFHEAQKHAALGRMAGGVAHDFNNILAIMMGYADVARRRLPEGDANARRMAEIVKAAERGKALIAQILAFTRARPPEHARLDLRASVAETAEWLQASIGRGVALELALPDAPLWIMGDATGAHQVVANLCVNAAHAMRSRAGAVSVTLDSLTIDGGRAEGLRASGLREKVGAEGPAVVLDESRADRLRAHVGLLRPGPHARVTVRDAGTGMAPEVFRHVFDPYFTTKPVGEGTGLGLAAVLGIVTQHDGAITLETAPGAGTMFAIFFPLTD